MNENVIDLVREEMERQQGENISMVNGKRRGKRSRYTQLLISRVKENDNT